MHTFIGRYIGKRALQEEAGRAGRRRLRRDAPAAVAAAGRYTYLPTYLPTT